MTHDSKHQEIWNVTLTLWTLRSIGRAESGQIRLNVILIRKFLELRVNICTDFDKVPELVHSVTFQIS